MDQKPVSEEVINLEAITALRNAANAEPENMERQIQLAAALVQAAKQIPKTDAPPTDFFQRIRDRFLGKVSNVRSETLRDTWLDEAARALHKALEQDPNHGPAHFHLASVWYQRRRFSEMVSEARKAVMAEPFNGAFKEFLLTAEDIYMTHAGRSAARVRELSWDDLVLDLKTKKELDTTIRLLRHPAQARDLGIDPPTGILLAGPPGTGKTTIARIMSATAQCKFIAADPAQINSMWVGQSEKNVHALFRKARREAPAIIFLDELDALLPIRGTDIGHHTDLVTNQFLQEIDGLMINDRIFVVGATNRPDLVDPAMLRGGRLSRRIDIPLPDRAARKELLKLKTLSAKLSSGIDFEILADATVGMSGGDIKALVSEAGVQALLRHGEEGAPLEITLDDFRMAVRNLRPEMVWVLQSPNPFYLFWIRFWMRLQGLFNQPLGTSPRREIQRLGSGRSDTRRGEIKILGAHRAQKRI